MKVCSGCGVEGHTTGALKCRALSSVESPGNVEAELFESQWIKCKLRKG